MPKRSKGPLPPEEAPDHDDVAAVVSPVTPAAAPRTAPPPPKTLGWTPFVPAALPFAAPSKVYGRTAVERETMRAGGMAGSTRAAAAAVGASAGVSAVGRRARLREPSEPVESDILGHSRRAGGQRARRQPKATSSLHAYHQRHSPPKTESERGHASASSEHDSEQENSSTESEADERRGRRKVGTRGRKAKKQKVRASKVKSQSMECMRGDESSRSSCDAVLRLDELTLHTDCDDLAGGRDRIGPCDRPSQAILGGSRRNGGM